MTLARYAEGWRTLQATAPEIHSAQLLLRIVAWKLCRMSGARPVVRLHGHCRMRLEAERDDHGIRAAIFLLRDAYEPSVRAAIDRFVRPGDRCYDIGANLGLWSLRMAERVGASGRVVAFEALPSTAERLAANVALSKLENVEILPVALGAEAGPGTIYVADDPGRSSFAAESARDRAVPVTTQRLDDLWHAQGRPAVRFVKMDVEGAEPLVLEGGKAFFAAVRPITCCEVNPEKLRDMAFSPRQLFERFAAWGYSPFIWSERHGALRRYVAPAGPRQVDDLVFLPD